MIIKNNAFYNNAFFKKMTLNVKLAWMKQKLQITDLTYYFTQLTPHTSVN